MLDEEHEHVPTPETKLNQGEAVDQLKLLCVLLDYQLARFRNTDPDR
jgi:hypothetical protein